MTPAVFNFRIKTNGYYSQVWQINSNNVAVDLTGYTFELTAKTNKGISGRKIIELTTGSGITINDAVNGKLLIEIAPNVSIKDTTIVFYDLLAKHGGKEYVWIEGKITLDPGVSYLADD